MRSEIGVIRLWSCKEAYSKKKQPIFHIIPEKNKITLSNRFGALLPYFRSRNELYKHLDGVGLLLGSPNRGQLKKSDSESHTLQHN